MRRFVSKLPPQAKSLAKTLARQTVGRLPLSPSRLTGTLAKDGGKPVRDVRFRPWPSAHAVNAWHWFREVGPTMRRIFVSAAEGLPQPLAKQFAEDWAKYCDCRHALVLPHGTDALRIGLAAVFDHDGLDYGGEIIVPNLSFIASANASLDRRFGVVFVDVDPMTLNLDPNRLEEAIVPGKTRGIMPVHLFGHPADMTAIKAIARKHALHVIEDAAQAHGAIHDEGPAGSLGDAAAFSFQSAKNLPSGEGGALTTNDSAVFERAHALHNVGRARIGGLRWGHETLGWNCRVTEYVAAVLLHRLRHLEQQQEHRYAKFLSLLKRLEEIPCVEPLGLGPGLRRHGVHMFVMRYRPEACGGLQMTDFLHALQAEGLPVDRAYACTLMQQPAMQKLAAKHPDYIRALPTPVADQAVREIIYLPHNVFLGDDNDLEEIVAGFRKVQEHYAPKTTAGFRAGRASVGNEGALTSSTATRPVTSSVQRIRCGIIGAGVMGKNHAAVLVKHPYVGLVAITDAESQARAVAAQFDCKWFRSTEEMLRSGEVDAVVIATPHWQHAELAIECLQAGLHVICEKPLAATVAQADKVLRVAAKCRGMFAVVHQTRFEPAYAHVKRLLESGEFGPIYRCLMVESAWRTDAYYRSSPWRGTWKGEGGGVLLNQAPHVLDRYAWLCGMPEAITARCDTNLHQIEVEDTASAVLRHASGAHGQIHVSTNECPPVSQTVIACDRGRITIENGHVTMTKLRDSIREKTAADPRPWGEVESETREISGGLVNSFEQLLTALYDNFALAAAGTVKLACPGQEGRNAVELANAMILSSALGQSVPLPLDRVAYDRFITSKEGAAPKMDVFQNA